MDLKIVKSLEGTGYDYKEGQVVENAEEIFGAAQARYFIETGHAEPAGKKIEKATAKGGETPEK